MGEVYLALEIRPESAEINVEELLEKIKQKLAESEKIKILEASIEPFVFGLKVIKLKVIIPEEEGAQDYLEAIIKGVEGVEDVIVEDFSRV